MPEPRPKHVPLRRCVACRRSRPQAELFRLVQDDSGHWQFDLRRRVPGRGAWLCKDSVNCRQPKALGRFFRAQAGRIAEEAVVLSGEADALEPKTGKDPIENTWTDAKTDTKEARNGGMNAR